MILASSFASTMQIGFWTRVRVRVILLGGKMMAHRPSVELTVQIGTPTCHSYSRGSPVANTGGNTIASALASCSPRPLGVV